MSSEGRDLLFSGEANCAQIGVSTGSVAESGGVVFSFPCGCDCCCGAYERSLLDLFILPTIGILYILNYIDRQNLSAAKLQGIMEDLNMNEQQFATAISILFVGYAFDRPTHDYPLTLRKISPIPNP